MKKIKYLLLISIISLGVSSCSDFLNTNPSTSTTKDEVFKTVKGADATYNGAFLGLMSWFNSYAYPGYNSILMMADVSTEDVVSFKSYGAPWSQYQFLVTNNYTSGAGSVIWTKAYYTINQCNIIIENIKDKTDVGFKDVLGQAYFLRAFCYFDLVRLYQFTYIANKDKGVCPIYTQPMKLTDKGNALSTVEQVYSQIVEDLTKAETLLEKFVPGDIDRPSLSVVQGYFARVYLTMEKWENAAKYAKLARAGKSLMSGEEFAGGFNNRTNKEWMFMFGQSSDQSDMSYTFHYKDNNIRPNGSSYYASLRVDPFLFEKMEENDVRKKGMFSWDVQPVPKGFLIYQKFRFKNATDEAVDLLLMRVSEMYLIEAEALAHQNTDAKKTEALAVINTLRAARNATLFAATLSNDELVQKILLERRIELWGEGFGLFDVLRTQRNIDRKEVMDAKGNYLFNFDNLPLPIIGGKPIVAKGHSVLTDPSGGKFTANSKYYLFSVPEKEVINNPNINKPE